VADDHQLANVRAFANRTGTAWTREVDWNETAMAESLARALGNADAWTMAAARMRAAASPDAASAVVDACERLLAGGPWGETPDALKAASTRSARR
jgi:UDP-N-acetylglucosamine:LPS N-acetylglucosamine transferase